MKKVFFIALAVLGLHSIVYGSVRIKVRVSHDGKKATKINQRAEKKALKEQEPVKRAGDFSPSGTLENEGIALSDTGGSLLTFGPAVYDAESRRLFAGAAVKGGAFSVVSFSVKDTGIDPTDIVGITPERALVNGVEKNNPLFSRVIKELEIIGSGDKKNLVVRVETDPFSEKDPEVFIISDLDAGKTVFVSPVDDVATALRDAAGNLAVAGPLALTGGEWGDEHVVFAAVQDHKGTNRGIVPNPAKVKEVLAAGTSTLLSTAVGDNRPLAARVFSQMLNAPQIVEAIDRLVDRYALADGSGPLPLESAQELVTHGLLRPGSEDIIGLTTQLIGLDTASVIPRIRVPVDMAKWVPPFVVSTLQREVLNNVVGPAAALSDSLAIGVQHCCELLASWLPRRALRSASFTKSDGTTIVQGFRDSLQPNQPLLRFAAQQVLTGWDTFAPAVAAVMGRRDDTATITGKFVEQAALRGAHPVGLPSILDRVMTVLGADNFVVTSGIGALPSGQDLVLVTDGIKNNSADPDITAVAKNIVSAPLDADTAVNGTSAAMTMILVQVVRNAAALDSVDIDDYAKNIDDGLTVLQTYLTNQNRDKAALSVFNVKQKFSSDKLFRDKIQSLLEKLVGGVFDAGVVFLQQDALFNEGGSLVAAFGELLSTIDKTDLSATLKIGRAVFKNLSLFTDLDELVVQTFREIIAVKPRIENHLTAKREDIANELSRGCSAAVFGGIVWALHNIQDTDFHDDVIEKYFQPFIGKLQELAKQEGYTFSDTIFSIMLFPNFKGRSLGLTISDIALKIHRLFTIENYAPTADEWIRSAEQEEFRQDIAEAGMLLSKERMQALLPGQEGLIQIAQKGTVADAVDFVTERYGFSSSAAIDNPAAAVVGFLTSVIGHSIARIDLNVTDETRLRYLFDASSTAVGYVKALESRSVTVSAQVVNRLLLDGGDTGVQGICHDMVAQEILFGAQESARYFLQKMHDGVGVYQKLVDEIVAVVSSSATPIRDGIDSRRIADVAKRATSADSAVAISVNKSTSSASPNQSPLVAQDGLTEGAVAAIEAMFGYAVKTGAVDASHMRPWTTGDDDGVDRGIAVLKLRDRALHAVPHDQVAEATQSGGNATAARFSLDAAVHNASREGFPVAVRTAGSGSMDTAAMVETVPEVSTSPVLHWDATLQTLFVGLKGVTRGRKVPAKNGIVEDHSQRGGVVGLLVGHIENGTLVLKPFLHNFDQQFLNVTDSDAAAAHAPATYGDIGTPFGFYRDSDDATNPAGQLMVSVHDVKIMHTSTKRPFALVYGSVSSKFKHLIRNPQLTLYPLVQRGEHRGQLAKRDGKTVADGSDKDTYVFPLTAQENSMSKRVKLKPLRSDIDAIRVLGDSIYVSTSGFSNSSGGVIAQGGIFYCTLLFDEKGDVVDVTDWEPFGGDVEDSGTTSRELGWKASAMDFGIDPKTHAALFISTEDGTHRTKSTTLRGTVWGADNDTNLDLILAEHFTPAAGGMSGLQFFNEQTPGFAKGAFSMAVAFGGEQVALIEMARRANAIYRPVVTFSDHPLDASQNIFVFNDPAIGAVAPLLCSEVQRDAGSIHSNSGYLYLGGYSRGNKQGIIVLRDSQGRGWDTASGLKRLTNEANKFPGDMEKSGSFDTDRLSRFSFDHFPVEGLEEGDFVYSILCNGPDMHILTQNKVIRIRNVLTAPQTDIQRFPVINGSFVHCSRMQLIGDSTSGYKGLIACNRGLLVTDFTNGKEPILAVPLSSVDDFSYLSSSRALASAQGNIYCLAGNVDKDISWLYRFYIDASQPLDNVVQVIDSDGLAPLITFDSFRHHLFVQGDHAITGKMPKTTGNDKLMSVSSLSSGATYNLTSFLKGSGAIEFFGRGAAGPAGAVLLPQWQRTLSTHR